MRIDESELVTIGQQISLMDIEQNVEMSGAIRVIFQLPEVLDNVCQSDRTDTARANQPSGLVDDVRYRHSHDSKRIMHSGILSVKAIFRQGIGRRPSSG